MAKHDDIRSPIRQIQASEHPSHTSHELPLWVQRQDLTEADLPYTHTLLSGSFADWQEQIEGFPWPTEFPILLLHPDGTAVGHTSIGIEEPGMAPRNWSADSLGRMRPSSRSRHAGRRCFARTSIPRRR